MTDRLYAQALAAIDPEADPDPIESQIRAIMAAGPWTWCLGDGWAFVVQARAAGVSIADAVAFLRVLSARGMANGSRSVLAWAQIIAHGRLGLDECRSIAEDTGL